jgi:beta-galactosidase
LRRLSNSLILSESSSEAIGRDFPQNSVGWYRTPIAVTVADRERRLWLEFDGVFRDCIVFVNGYIVGRNESGYAPFSVSIGDFLDYEGGPKVVVVRVDASLGEGWFYEGAGIYRHVDLVRTDRVHVRNDGAEAAEAIVRQRIVDAAGRPAVAVPDTRVTVPAGSCSTASRSY